MKSKALCPLILNLFIKKLGKICTNKTEDGPETYFPSFLGKATVFSFTLYDMRFTLVRHISLDESEFVFKLFKGDNPELYFVTDSRKKIFSRKAYRQNDPYLFKVIYHQDLWKENWMEKQFPLNNPNSKDIIRAVRKVQDLFLMAEKQVFKKL